MMNSLENTRSQRKGERAKRHAIKEFSYKIQYTVENRGDVFAAYVAISISGVLFSQNCTCFGFR